MVQHDASETGDVPAGLDEILREARRRGLLGTVDVREAVLHSRGFAAGAGRAPERLLDLGSGGGLPGLVLAHMWPSTRVVLLDGRITRVEFLRWAVQRLGWSDRVDPVARRAEEAGRSPEFRGCFDMVVARGFGRPAVTAECAAPMLKVRGLLVVSEPPDPEGGRSARWPDAGLALLGLERAPSWESPYAYQAAVQKELCPERYPRRVGVPAKRPLF